MNLPNVEKFITAYTENYKPYKASWNYEDGCVLKGAADIFSANADSGLYAFIEAYLDEYISASGNIKGYSSDEYNIDNINSGKILLFMLDKTQKDCFRTAADSVFKQIFSHPRTREGNFWHKSIYPEQVWLDGLYMCMPFYADYSKRFRNKTDFDDIMNQFRNVRKYMFSEEKRLYYHGYDSSRKERWADPETGLSPNFWGRSVGWLLMAMTDTAEIMGKDGKELSNLLVEALTGIAAYTDTESGMFLQLLDRPDLEGNYPETSASLMISYSMMKASRLGYIHAGFATAGKNMFEAVTDRYLAENGNGYQLEGICGVAGLGNSPYRDGSAEYYLSEKIVNNDPKGCGALMMAYSEILMLKK